MSVMRVIVLDPYTKFEVRRLSRFEDVADFRSRR